MALTENQERIISEYTASLERKLRENMARIPGDVFGADGHVIRWLGAEITRDPSPAVVKAGRAIKRDLVYYELSL